MDRERVIILAKKIVYLTDKVKAGWAEVARCESSLHSAKHEVNEAREALSVAVGEIAGDRRERHAEFAPERVSEVNRKWRWRRLLDMTGADDVKEFFYRSPLYASLAKELGMGAQDTYVPKSGQTYRCVWLTEDEHGAILALTKERYPKE
mgnify:CR=1 FL=1|tara:strand:+ start:15071 stop:15520 length:450 start_codon:yes stop_codon:yes gene_type:complete